MLTLFTCPKAFTGHINIIQRNALLSWQRIDPAPEIILLGDDPGTAETALEMGLKHIPIIERNEYGTPLVSSVFEKAQEHAKHDLMGYVNADILLPGEFPSVINKIGASFSRFLLIGQRWDLDITEPIDFTRNWEEHLAILMKKNGKLHPPSGKDYYIFQKGFYKNIPPFAIGRGMWDDWLVYYGVKKKTAVIDITPGIKIIHQNHDYKHIDKTKKDFSGPEAKTNVRLGGRNHAYSSEDANFVLSSNGFIKKSWMYRMRRRIGHELYPYKMWLLENLIR